ncbi:C1q-related factor-like [Mya arenaria]|uniref:C1q-related factor-like n=1 Tax=Mya arenaria TaxID=6604 RepID=UPI0022DF7B1B|nr:C1q-related factor-like [Mya arenaria]
MVNNSLSDANKLISERLQNLSSSSQSDSKSVVFSASGGQLSSGQGLRFMVFSNLHVNTGNGYDTVSGVFTVPVEGEYLFTASVQKTDTGNDFIRCYIQKNGRDLVLMYSKGVFPGDSPSASNSVIINGKLGDRFQVGQCTGADSPLPRGTTFSGVLLH